MNVNAGHDKCPNARVNASHADTMEKSTWGMLEWERAFVCEQIAGHRCKGGFSCEYDEEYYSVVTEESLHNSVTLSSGNHRYGLAIRWKLQIGKRRALIS